MKHLRLILLLLAVCFTQISFSQDLAKKLESERILKSIISEILAEADTEQEAENKISSLLEGDADYITEQEKVNVANEYFEKCKKKLAKWDAKLAAGKKVYYEDAMYAANYYALGFKKICNQDYSKALEYLKLCPQIPVTKMYTVALQYQLNKDKAAALAAMSFINKPSKQLSDVASQYGLEDVYHEKLMSLIADKKQTLKRAIRSKDFETLLSFIPYDIPVVDSLFATCDVDIAIARYTKDNNLYGRNIEEVEDFDDRNVIKIYKVGDYELEWSNIKDYKDYFINKCAFKHEMPWAMSKVNLDFEKIARSYPVKQQMLAIARALMSRPKLLLLDEPSLGLAPIVVKQIFQTLRELARNGMTIFLVEQNAHHALKLSDRGYVMVNGQIRLSGSGEELLGNEDVRKAYLGGV